jgi:hypothetical protein
MVRLKDFRGAASEIVDETQILLAKLRYGPVVGGQHTADVSGFSHEWRGLDGADACIQHDFRGGRSRQKWGCSRCQEWRPSGFSLTLLLNILGAWSLSELGAESEFPYDRDAMGKTGRLSPSFSSKSTARMTIFSR